MKQLDDYFSTLQAVYDYFGYEESWSVFTLYDEREHHWMVDETAHGDGVCVHSKEPLTVESVQGDGNLYSGELRRCGRSDGKVYRGEEYTMVCYDTRTDGNVVLIVFSNNRECKDKEVMKTYLDQ